MKTKMIAILATISLAWLLTIILLFVFLPKKQNTNYKKLNEVKYFEVKLSGAINFPGFYTARKGDSLETIVNYAMGLSKDADIDKVSLSREVKESEKEIIIPFKKKIKDEKINLNSASYEVLKESKLLNENRIVEILIYRKKNKSFKSVDELKNIKGIGDVFFNKIKDRFTI